jgi:hypothetical protein
MTDQEILDAIDNAVRKVADRFRAKREAEAKAKAEAEQAVRSAA